MSEPGEMSALLDALYPILSHFEVRASGDGFEVAVRVTTDDGLTLSLARTVADPVEGATALLCEVTARINARRPPVLRQGTTADEIAHALQTLLACLRRESAWSRSPDTGAAMARATAALRAAHEVT